MARAETQNLYAKNRIYVKTTGDFVVCTLSGKRCRPRDDGVLSNKQGEGVIDKILLFHVQVTVFLS